MRSSASRELLCVLPLRVCCGPLQAFDYCGVLCSLSLQEANARRELHVLRVCVHAHNVEARTAHNLRGVAPRGLRSSALQARNVRTQAVKDKLDLFLRGPALFLHQQPVYNHMQGAIHASGGAQLAHRTHESPPQRLVPVRGVHHAPLRHTFGRRRRMLKGREYLHTYIYIYIYIYI